MRGVHRVSRHFQGRSTPKRAVDCDMQWLAKGALIAAAVAVGAAVAVFVVLNGPLAAIKVTTAKVERADLTPQLFGIARSKPGALTPADLQVRQHDPSGLRVRHPDRSRTGGTGRRPCAECLAPGVRQRGHVG